MKSSRNNKSGSGSELNKFASGFSGLLIIVFIIISGYAIYLMFIRSFIESQFVNNKDRIENDGLVHNRAERQQQDSIADIQPIAAEKRKKEPALQSGTFTDSRDAQTYKWVKVGSQVWMAENLNYNTAGGSRCFDNNPSNCKKYGRLYTWKVAKNACPPGWHLPTDSEWLQLTNYIGTSPGTRLKSSTGWPQNGNGTDAFGFSALPGGTAVSDRIFGLIGYHGYWWSATEFNSDKAWLRIIYYNYGGIDRISDSKELGLSVRCVRD